MSLILSSLSWWLWCSSFSFFVLFSFNSPSLTMLSVLSNMVVLFSLISLTLMEPRSAVSGCTYAFHTCTKPLEPVLHIFHSSHFCTLHRCSAMPSWIPCIRRESSCSGVSEFNSHNTMCPCLSADHIRRSTCKKHEMGASCTVRIASHYRLDKFQIRMVVSYPPLHNCCRRWPAKGWMVANEVTLRICPVNVYKQASYSLVVVVLSVFTDSLFVLSLMFEVFKEVMDALRVSTFICSGAYGFHALMVESSLPEKSTLPVMPQYADRHRTPPPCP